LVGALAARFGARRLDLIEDAVQDALVAAMRTWPHHGKPNNPAAWLTTSARNALLDRLRQRRFESDDASTAIDADAELDPELSLETVGMRDERAFDDAQVRLLVYCCHPVLSTAAQVTLTLRLACGLSTDEIARALYAAPESAAQRIVRAKQQLRAAAVQFEMPPAAELAERRLPGMAHTIYLLFNAGYSSAADAEPIRPLLVADALHLVTLLLGHEITATPATFALGALLCLTAARMPARRDSRGSLVRLEHQDRNLWNRELIARGFDLLNASLAGTELTRYHEEAAIAAEHARAPSFDATDWRAIAAHYDRLVERFPSPAAAIGRAVALRYAGSPTQGLAALREVAAHDDVESDLGYHAAHAELLYAIGDSHQAIDELRAAAALAGNTGLKQLFAAREREWREATDR
jgi:RNA polymerase sigma-70 factor (ECF subfamily)